MKIAKYVKYQAESDIYSFPDTVKSKYNFINRRILLWTDKKQSKEPKN